jgi:hypothetical protein
MTLVYPRPDDLKFLNANKLIENSAIFNEESRDYLKISIINSQNNSYSNYVGRGGSGAANASVSSTSLKIEETIFLYVPQQLSETFQQGYNTASIGMLGAGIMNMMAQRSDTTSMANELKEAANGLKPEAALSAMASAVSGIAQVAGVGGGGVDANTISQLQKGAILNPYKELIYQGTEFRSHSFDFKLVARNLSDAATIQKILGKLKYHMHPGVAGVGADEVFGNTTATENNTGTQNQTQQQSASGTATGKFDIKSLDAASERWLLLPDFFKLELVRMGSGGDTASAKPLQTLISFPTFCVLEGMTINYTPDNQYNPIKVGEQTSSDLGVIAVNLTLAFRETAMLTKVNFNKDYKVKPLENPNVSDQLQSLAKTQNK